MEEKKQPDVIHISKVLRLRRFPQDESFALKWYQDEETLWLVDGKNDPYDTDRLHQMYQYLRNLGELYVIEYRSEDGSPFIPIGDVTLARDDIPIVIGDPTMRGKGIGTQVILALMERARELGFHSLRVAEIYDYNMGSRKLFENCGFRAVKATEKGHSYERILPNGSKFT